jgi:hypothetical protein
MLLFAAVPITEQKLIPQPTFAEMPAKLNNQVPMLMCLDGLRRLILGRLNPRHHLFLRNQMIYPLQ